MSVKIVAINISVDNKGRVLDNTLSTLVVKLHHEMMSDGVDYKASDISHYTNYVAHLETLLKVVFYKKWRIELQNNHIDVVALYLDGQDQALGHYKILSNKFTPTPLLGFGPEQYWLEEIKTHTKAEQTNNPKLDETNQHDKPTETKTSSVKLMGAITEPAPETFMPF
jgi:hypothetical protein